MKEKQIETMTKRLSGILNRYKLPIALQVSINKTITVGIDMKTVSKDLPAKIKSLLQQTAQKHSQDFMTGTRL